MKYIIYILFGVGIIISILQLSGNNNANVQANCWKDASSSKNYLLKDNYDNTKLAELERNYYLDCVHQQGLAN